MEAKLPHRGCFMTDFAVRYRSLVNDVSDISGPIIPVPRQVSREVKEDYRRYVWMHVTLMGR